MVVLAERLRRLSELVGRVVDVDGPSLLGERAALTGHGRQGHVSCGGSGRLLRAADGWIAVSLARDDDVASVPAWLEAEIDSGDPVALESAIAERPCARLVERAILLGMPCAALGEVTGSFINAHHLGAADAMTSVASAVVVDLSSLWAGPLCTQLLADAGATVIKVESTTRPDGARRGSPAFFDLLHAGKQNVALDLTTPMGLRTLHQLLDRADVVVEASRPRALQQLGVDAWSTSARVWLSITGYGRDHASRVAFGDDAAVAGGLVAWDHEGPVFAADAAADPIAGLIGAVAVLDRLAIGGRWLVDLALARSAALMTADGPGRGAWHGDIASPRARPSRGRAAGLGDDTDRIVARLNGASG